MTPGDTEPTTEALDRAEAALADLRARVDSAQQLADMGDYDWEIATDTNSWSDQLYRIYGYQPQSFNASYERFLSMIHPDDRERVEAIHQRAYQTGGGYQMIERIVRPDGEVRYLSSNGEVITDEEGTPVRMRGTCLDITERLLAERAREQLVANLREAQVRRRQSLEINDNLVQGLTVAVMCMESGDRAGAAAHLEMVLDAARTMMNNLLVNPDGTPLVPGDLMRSTPSSLDAPGSDGPAAQTAEQSVRVLVVDDHAQVRELLCAQLVAGGHRVVGEAADGVEAVEKTAALQPDVVVLDLAMPRLDGLTALAGIRQAAPGARVIVLSGFDDAMMADRAVASGALRYVEKGTSMNIAETVREAVLGRA
ncbi:PAS domain-containing protein [Nocardioides bizhenqiangii]|uniref:histidine kinase n=1 Tax=Nocardioides bizhenqiangii TaxID=3095076 RepID=A0ABZ0ZPV8_9ACTN|nr:MULTISPECIES: PAS domain-containing protein [unclassified Nocardioides]MDZ5619610.1 PAS domain-containing protein [Nocardioides sp. HM23]WQQ26375.1 PAS domain-containing protein [Nocardioides sp. HM61]